MKCLKAAEFYIILGKIQQIKNIAKSLRTNKL